MNDIVSGVKYIDIFKLLKKIKLRDNEPIIELLINKHKVSNVNLESKGIKVVDFEKLNHYCKNGYFLFEDGARGRCFAVNNIFLIKEKR